MIMLSKDSFNACQLLKGMEKVLSETMAQLNTCPSTMEYLILNHKTQGNNLTQVTTPTKMQFDMMSMGIKWTCNPELQWNT